jgi:cytochrome c oxidase cbb3-type subunit 3
MSLSSINGSKRKAAVLSALLTITFATTAQETAATPSGGANWLEILLILSAVVLLVVIWGMGQVLLILGKQLIQKKRSEAASKALMIILGLFAYGSASAQDAAAEAAPAVEVPANYGGLSALEFWSLATVIGIEVLVILFLAFMARRMYRELTGAADSALAKAAAAPESNFASWWSSLDKRFFTRAVPVEKEADVLLDHDYDGIRELDNALPPWWKYGFYFTIVVAVIYIGHYHVFGTGMNPEQEYAAEMEAGKRVEEAYKAKTKNLVDENNITMSDAAGIADGKKLYTQSCVACHGAAGEGGIGPNLTDEYWLHGSSMNDIYKTIKLGYPDKGMQAWESMFSPVQMKDLSSYVKSLKGTKPANAKAPQGEIYKD